MAICIRPEASSVRYHIHSMIFRGLPAQLSTADSGTPHTYSSMADSEHHTGKAVLGQIAVPLIRVQ